MLDHSNKNNTEKTTMLKLTVNCYSDDATGFPVCALVNIDETAMSRIRLFAAFVKDNKLYRVEGFDYSPEWYSVDVDENVAPSDLPADNLASVDCRHCLSRPDRG